jgi:hypothetical protein
VLRRRTEGVVASVTGGAARAATERNNGEIRAVAMNVERMYYLLDANSNRHNYGPKFIRLSIKIAGPFIFMSMQMVIC